MSEQDYTPIDFIDLFFMLLVPTYPFIMGPIAILQWVVRRNPAILVFLYLAMNGEVELDAKSFLPGLPEKLSKTNEKAKE